MFELCVAMCEDFDFYQNIVCVLFRVVWRLHKIFKVSLVCDCVCYMLWFLETLKVSIDPLCVSSVVLFVKNFKILKVFLVCRFCVVWWVKCLECCLSVMDSDFSLCRERQTEKTLTNHNI